MNAQISGLPLLFLIQVLFLLAIAWRTKSRTAMAGVLIVSAALASWGAASTWLAFSGTYDDPRFLALFPGLWLSLVPFVVAGTALTLPTVRRGIDQVIAVTPPHWFVAIQAFRITALGTLTKTLAGAFPLSVELAVGLTDLAFGLSAIWLYRLARAGRVSADALALWHIVGVLIIVLPGGISIQSGLPGPLQVFAAAPTAEVILDWPMVLAPSLIVPTFLLLNILGAVALLRRTGVGTGRGAAAS